MFGALRTFGGFQKEMLMQHIYFPPLFVCNYSVERSGGMLRTYGAVQNEQKRVTRNFSRSVEAGAASAHIVRYGVSYFAP